MADRFDFENEQQHQGAYISFSNIQAEDLFLFAVLLDVQKCKENKAVHRIFQQQYRPISLFSMEEIYTGINSSILGNTQTTEIHVNGDLIYNIALVNTYEAISHDQLIPDPLDATDLTRFTLKKFAYCTNLGCSQIRSSIFQLESQGIDQTNTDNLVILNNLLRRVDQRNYFNKLQGNTEALTTLKPSHPKFKTLTMLKMFFSNDSQKSFPYLRAGQPTVKIQTKFREPQELVCYTNNLAGFDWNTKAAPSKVGYISTEIFLNEHERILHVNTDAHSLFEQNMIYEQVGLTNKFETNFLHPVKYLYWALKKDKYYTGKTFLAFDSFANPDKSREEFLYDATVRFVQRFASYKLLVDWGDASLTGDAAAVAVMTAPQLAELVVAPETVPITLLYNVDVNDNIQSMFSNNSQGAADTLNFQLVAEANTTVHSIDAIFKRLQCQPLVINNVQKFKKENSFVLAAGDLLTLAEASVPVSEWESHIPNATVTTPWIPLVKVGTPATSQVTQNLFSLYDSGAPVIKHGTTNQFTAPLPVVYKGTAPFSNIVRDDKFNYGLNDFDIRVMQWDNYGKYLDKSGDAVVTSELQIGQQPRFKKSGFYTSQYHQMQFFPGVSPEGVHLQTFALNPDAIQSSGSLNFTKAEGKMTIVSDTPADANSDKVIVGAVVYNVIDFQENTHQILYSTPMVV